MPKKLFCCILPRWVRDNCIYCGNPATCRDHYRPWSYYEEPYWLPACRECNTLLGRKCHQLLGERITAAADRFRRKYEGVLDTNYDAVLPRVQNTLRRRFICEKKTQNTVLHRLKWADAMAALFQDVPLENLHCNKDALTAVEGLLSSLERAEYGLLEVAV